MGRLYTTGTRKLALHMHLHMRTYDAIVNVPRGGHSYVYCTDIRDWDQNLIGPILGLDRLIPAGKLP